MNPAEVSLRVIAEPTRPVCPATKTRASFDTLVTLNPLESPLLSGVGCRVSKDILGRKSRPLEPHGRRFHRALTESLGSCLDSHKRTQDCRLECLGRVYPLDDIADA